MLQKVVNDRRPSMFAVAMDSRGPSFRKAIDVRYKATRQVAPPDLGQQMARCEQFARASNIPIFQAEGIEADDLIAAVVERAVREGVRVVIVSADKDLMQLIHDTDDRVLMWDSMRDRTYGAPEVALKFGVPPSQLRDLLALTGDTSDNIPGVPSVGPKTAADLLREYQTLDGVYANLAAIKRVKLRETLQKHETDARISQVLVTLKRDVEVAWSQDSLRYGGANVETLRTFFLELELTRFLDQLSAAEARLGTGQSPHVGDKGAGRADVMVAAAARRIPPTAPALERSYRPVLDETELGRVVARARGRWARSLFIS